MFSVLCHYANGDTICVAARDRSYEARELADAFNHHAPADGRSHTVEHRSEEWPLCEGCGKETVRIGGVYACVGDFCLLACGPHQRGLLRQAARTRT